METDHIHDKVDDLIVATQNKGVRSKLVCNHVIGDIILFESHACKRFNSYVNEKKMDQ